MALILLIEKRPFFRDCLLECFIRANPNRKIVALDSIDEWANSDRRDRPNLVIYSAQNGLTPAIKAEFETFLHAAPSVPIVVVGDTARPDDIMRIIDYGAQGYVPTSMSFGLAVEAVRFVEAGGTFVPAAQFLARSSQISEVRGTQILTERQMKVVEAVCRGFANKQIAYQLKMSENTVKVHLRHIMKKLNVRNRTEIVILTRSMFDLSGERPLGEPGCGWAR